MSLLLALCLAAVPPPLPFQETSPVPRLFLQPVMDAPEGLAAGRLGGSLRLLYSNSILEAAAAGRTLDVDLEEARVTAELRWGVTGWMELRVAVPAMVDWGGFLDGPIGALERAFNGSNPERLARARGRARFLLTDPSGGIDRSGPTAGAGDPEIGVKLGLASQDGLLPALALRAALGIPASTPPWGSGTLDAGGGLLAEWLGPRAAIRLAVDVTAPAAGAAPAGLQTRPFPTAQLGYTYELSERSAVHLQLSGHGAPVRGSGISELDGADYYVLAGATVRIARAVALELGAADGIFSPYRGADLIFLAGLRFLP